MTRTVTSIGLREIATITIACSSCGYAVTVPVDAPHIGGDGCGKCGRSFPGKAVSDLAGQVENVRRILSGKDRDGLDIMIEIVEKE